MLLRLCALRLGRWRKHEKGTGRHSGGCARPLSRGGEVPGPPQCPKRIVPILVNQKSPFVYGFVALSHTNITLFGHSGYFRGHFQAIFG